MTRSTSFNPTGASITNASLEVDTQNTWVSGIYDDDKIVNPGYDAWKDVLNSDEAAKAFSNVTNQSGKSAVSAPFPIIDKFYSQEYKKYSNRELEPDRVYNVGSNTGNSKTSPNNKPSAPATPRDTTKSEASGKNGKFAVKYPIDLDFEQDHLRILRYAYSRNNDLNASGFVGNTAVSKDTRGEFRGMIALPMPKVSDSNAASWGESDVNMLQLGQMSGFKGMAAPQETSNRVAEWFRKMFQKRDVTGGAADAPGANQTNVLGDIGSIAGAGAAVLGTGIDTDTMLARSKGQIQNPNTELLFKGPALRDFQFTYEMVARSQREGEHIRKIIKWLKHGMAPKFMNRALMGTPDIFHLQYTQGGGSGNLLATANKFKDMALAQLTVDYAPEGYWSAYDDSQPVAVVLNFQFSELKPIYDRDQNEGKNDVGF